MSSKAKLPTPTKLNSVGVTRDDFETWWHFVKIYCQQNSDYNQFFEGGQYSSWKPECKDVTRGITVEPDMTDEDQGKAISKSILETEKIRLLLTSLLTTIAAFCPEGTFKPVLTESTSIAWIKDRIAKVCKIQTTGRHLPKILNIKWDSDKDTPDAFFLKIKSSFQDSLMPRGTMYHGAPLHGPETLGPLTESIIVIKWLEAIHPGLPTYIMENRGDLFTEQSPNFCDIQPELCNIMDSLLAKVQESEYNVSRTTSQSDRSDYIRWTRTQTKPYQQAQHKPSAPQKSFTNSTRFKPKKEVCDYCIATGKDEKVWSTHTPQNCFSLFPEKRKPRVRMVTIPVPTEHDDPITLHEAMEALTNSYQSMGYLDEEEYEEQ